VLKTVRAAFLAIFLVIILMGTAIGNVAAATYGSGTFGGGTYNVGAVPASAGTPANTASSDGGSPSPSVCGFEKPASAPDLFQVNAKASSVTLLFSPSSGEWDRYFVSYGTNPDAQTYGFEFMNSSNGVVSIDVGSLQARTTYYFKVRAGNRCQPGDWSNVLSVRTGQPISSFRWSLLPKVITTTIRQRIQPRSVQNLTGDTATPPATSSPAVSPLPTSKPVVPTSSSAPVQPPKTSSTPSFLQRVQDFFHSLTGK
jgi:hypothetical protein